MAFTIILQVLCIMRGIPLVNTSKYVFLPTMLPVLSRPGPAAVTLVGSPGWGSTMTKNGLLGISLPANLTITLYWPSMVGVYVTE